MIKNFDDYESTYFSIRQVGTFADICCPIFKNFSTLITHCISIFYSPFSPFFAMLNDNKWQLASTVLYLCIRKERELSEDNERGISQGRQMEVRAVFQIFQHFESTKRKNLLKVVTFAFANRKILIKNRNENFKRKNIEGWPLLWGRHS